MRARSIAAPLTLLVLAACTRKAAPAAPAPQAPAEASAPLGTSGPLGPLGPDDEIKPVYAAFAGPVLPIAGSLCRALHAIPDERRAACCAGKPGTESEVAAECAKIVSAAVRAGGIALEPAAVQACVDAEAKATQGCAWVAQGLPALPKECAQLIRGTVASGGLCRSSLECADGQTCLGSGPTAAGHCGAPKADGTACLASIDALASFLRDADDARHPECAGFCGHRRCEAKFAPGAACFLARQCSAEQHCDGKSCVAGPFASAGEACVVDACAPGLRCVNRVCRAPKPAGAACKQDFECIAGCLPKEQVCGLRCDLR